MANLEEELFTLDEIDDMNRIQHVLMAYAEIIANIPVRDYVQTNDQITLFFETTEKLNRPAFYLDLIAHFCKHTPQDIEKFAPIYLDNAFKYMNHPDQSLVAKVIAAFDSIMGRLSKETQML